VLKAVLKAVLRPVFLATRRNPAPQPGGILAITTCP
jgi:hypothetical protein